MEMISSTMGGLQQPFIAVSRVRTGRQSSCNLLVCELQQVQKFLDDFIEEYMLLLP